VSENDEIKKVPKATVKEGKAGEPKEVLPEIDDYARDVFVAMGHKEPLSRALLTAYAAAKYKKDLVHPGRMSVETMAVISLLAECADGVIALPKE